MEITISREKMSTEEKRKYLYALGIGFSIVGILSLFVGFNFPFFVFFSLLVALFSVYILGIGPEQIYYGKQIQGIEKELKNRGWIFLSGTRLPIHIMRVHNVSLRSLNTGYVYPAVLRLSSEQRHSITFTVDAYHGKILIPLDKIEDVTNAS